MSGELSRNLGGDDRDPNNGSMPLIGSQLREVGELEQALRGGNDECRVEDEDCREEICEEGGDERCEAEAEAAPNTGTAKEINILSLDYGYIVRVGCQKIAVESVDRLIANLFEYLTNPSATERKWFKEKKLL